MRASQWFASTSKWTSAATIQRAIRRSSLFPVPGVKWSLRTLEHKGVTKSWISVFNVDGEVLMDDKFIDDFKCVSRARRGLLRGV